MELNKAKGNRWCLQPFPGSDLKIGSVGAPNAFHRFMQQWLLGLIWTKQKGKYEAEEDN